MSYSEFPHANFEEQDDRQLISLYMKLETEYRSILELAENADKNAKEANAKVDLFLQTMETKINQQVANAVDKTTNDLKHQFNAVVDNFNQLRTEYNKLANEYNMFKHEMEREFVSFKGEINAEFEGLKYAIHDMIKQSDELTASRLNGMTTIIAVSLKEIEKKNKVYTDSQITVLDRKFGAVLTEKLDYITKLYEEIKNSNVYNNVGWLWNNLCSIGGFSAIEIFEYPDFNVDMWNLSEITCEEWFTSGKALLGYNTPQMLSPLTGKLESVGSIINLLIALLDSQGIIDNGYGALAVRGNKKGECLCAVPKHPT